MDSQANHVTGRRRLGAVDRIRRHPIGSTILGAIAAALATTALVLASSGNNSAVAASSVVNGNFETGDLTGWTVDTTNGGGANATNSYNYWRWGEDWWVHLRTMFPQEGSYFALL